MTVSKVTPNFHKMSLSQINKNPNEDNNSAIKEVIYVKIVLRRETEEKEEEKRENIAAIYKRKT